MAKVAFNSSVFLNSFVYSINLSQSDFKNKGLNFSPGLYIIWYLFHRDR